MGPTDSKLISRVLTTHSHDLGPDLKLSGVPCSDLVPPLPRLPRLQPGLDAVWKQSALLVPRQISEVISSAIEDVLQRGGASAVAPGMALGVVLSVVLRTAQPPQRLRRTLEQWLVSRARPD